MYFLNLSLGQFLAVFGAVAAVSVALIGLDMVLRSRRVHSGLAQEMIWSAVEQFLPAGVAGGLLAAVLLEYTPNDLWMLPGLWQIVFSLGVFACCRFLPGAIFAVGIWYLLVAAILQRYAVEEADGHA